QKPKKALARASVELEPFSSLNNSMDNLKFVNQHNMVAYLEKRDINTEFHQIVDFLSSFSITYGLTVSPTIYASYIEQFGNTASSKTVSSVMQIHAIVDGKAVVISESLVRSGLLFDDENGNVTPLLNNMLVQNQAPKGEGSATPPEPQSTPSISQPPATEEGDKVERVITTDASLEAVQDSDNIIKTQTTAMPNVDIPQGIDTGSSPRRQETIGGTSALTRSERVLEQPNEQPLTEGHTYGSGEGRLEENITLTNTVPTPHDLAFTGGYTPGSDEGRITLAELMETYTTLSNRKRSSSVMHSSYEEGPSVHIEDSSKQERIIEEMDRDKNINLVSKQGEVQETAEHSRDDDDETLAETLHNIKRSSSKDEGK
nr:hypothetical protein [Tanacetum cinerariifolium]